MYLNRKSGFKPDFFICKPTFNLLFLCYNQIRKLWNARKIKTKKIVTVPTLVIKKVYVAIVLLIIEISGSCQHVIFQTTLKDHMIDL